MIDRFSKATLISLLCATSFVSAQSMNGLKEEVVTIAEGARALLKSAKTKGTHLHSTEVTRRLNDGQVFFLRGDYSRSAIVLMDLVKRPGIESHPAYSDIVYYLADSLFMMGNDRSAVEFLRLLQKRAGKKRREWAMGRLLQICSRRPDVSYCDENRSEAFQVVSASSLPTLKYALGKALYRNKSYDEAQKVFELVQKNEALWSKSIYFLGVIELTRKAYDKALTRFNEIVGRYSEAAEQPSEEDREIYNMARLAVARILYEQTKLGEARDQYNQVESVSTAYDAAHYESIWLSIKEGDYKKSLRELELFMIKQEDVTTGYKAHLLKGRLLILLERFSDAQSSFAEVTNAFLPIRNELERTINENPDLEAHFQKKVGDNITDIDLSSLVPKAAADVVELELDTDEAVILVQEVGTQRRYVEDARRTIGKLRNALASEMRLEIFPALQRSYLTASEFLNRSLLAEAKLNDFIGQGLNDSAYLAQRQRRKEMAALFAKTPLKVNDFKARKGMMTEKLRALDMQVNQLSADLTSVDAQLTALKQFQRSQPNAVAAKGIAREMELALKLREELRALVWSLEDERSNLGAGDYASKKDREIRRRYREALERESMVLRRLKPRHTDLRESLSESRGHLDRFLAEVQNSVVDSIGVLRRDVEDEAKRLDDFESELRMRERDTSKLGGAIAASTFRRIYGAIRRIVLEADVGLVNMAWKRKQDETASIRRYQELKNDKVGRVEELFGEVSGE